MPPSLRILVVDDHAAFRAAVRELLSAAGFVVVGEAEDGSDAIAQAHARGPDVVLLDIGLPGLDGFEVCERLALLDRAPAVVLTSSRDAAEYGSRVAESGARGFVSKWTLTGRAIAELVG